MVTLLLFTTLLLTGCRSTYNDSTKIHTGMTRTELVAAIGEPHDSMSPGPGVEVLSYTFKKYRAYRLAFTLTKEYRVHLVDGKVEAYGTPRDLAKAAPYVAPKNEKTININVRTDGQTNAVAPVQPQLQLNEN